MEEIKKSNEKRRRVPSKKPAKKAVKANAVGEMFKSAKLSGTQTIVNINVKRAVCGLPPFYWKVTNVATGTIIEFIE